MACGTRWGLKPFSPVWRRRRRRRLNGLSRPLGFERIPQRLANSDYWRLNGLSCPLGFETLHSRRSAWRIERAKWPVVPVGV